MKSTMLAVIVTMVISALYSVQNIGTVTIRFLMFKWSFPQGVWDIVLFCSGAVMMWLFSLLASREVRNKYKREVKELKEKLGSMERDKKDLIDSIAAANTMQNPGDISYADPQPVSENPTVAGGVEEKV